MIILIYFNNFFFVNLINDKLDLFPETELPHFFFLNKNYISVFVFESIAICVLVRERI